MSRAANPKVKVPSLFALVVIATGAAASSSALALPVFGGPSSPPDGFQYANRVGPVTNAGVFYGNVGKRQPNGPPVSQTAFRWDTTAAPPQALLYIGGNAGAYSQSYVTAVNANGTAAVGQAQSYSANGLVQRAPAVRYGMTSPAPTQLDYLGTDASGNTSAIAVAVNVSGTSIGYANKFDASHVHKGERAVRWAQSATAAVELQNIGTNSGGYADVNAFDLNASGVAVGASSKYGVGPFAPDLGVRAVRWDAAGVATELGTLGTDANGSGYAIAVRVNDAGIGIGNSSKYAADGSLLGACAVRWDPNSAAAVELAGLGTDVGGLSFSGAADINAVGTIVGSARKYDAGGNDLGSRAARWDAAGNVHELGTIASTTNGPVQYSATRVNSLGVSVGQRVVGSADGSTIIESIPLMWGIDDIAINLNSYLPTNSGWSAWTDVGGLTDTGFVTGMASFDPDGAGGAAASARLFGMLIPAAGTYGKGDANFDAKVDFADLVILAQKYNLPNPSLATNVADFNLSGATDFQDLVMLAQHYGSGVALIDGLSGEDFAADWALAQTLVPEPVMPIVLAGFALVTTRQRRRRERAGGIHTACPPEEL